MTIATDLQPSWIIADGDNMPILDVRAIVTPLLEEDFGSTDYDDLAETVLLALQNPGNLRIDMTNDSAAPMVMRTVMWGVNGPILAPLEGRSRSHKAYTRSAGGRRSAVLAGSRRGPFANYPVRMEMDIDIQQIMIVTVIVASVLLLVAFYLVLNFFSRPHAKKDTSVPPEKPQRERCPIPGPGARRMEARTKMSSSSGGSIRSVSARRSSSDDTIILATAASWDDSPSCRSSFSSSSSSSSDSGYGGGDCGGGGGD